MTLIELIVVFIIIASMFGVSIVVVDLLDNSDLRAESFRLSNIIEATYGRAAINGQRYQLVFDLDENAYRAECSDENVALPGRLMGQDEHSFDEGLDRFSNFDEDDPEADPFNLNLQNSFDDCSEYIIPPHTMRDTVEIEAIMTTHQREPFDHGETTIGFFPNGFVEPSIIWLRRVGSETAVMTLFVDPMTGETRVEVGRQEIPQDFLEVEED